MIFKNNFQNIFKEDEKIFILKSNDLLKGEIYAYNIIKSLKYPLIPIYYDFEEKELFLIKLVEVLKEYAKEKGKVLLSLTLNLPLFNSSIISNLTFLKVNIRI